MQLKIFLRKKLFIFIFIVFFLFLGFVFNFTSEGQIENNLIQSISNTILLDALSPRRLKIPKINIDAVVEYVGLTSIGAMDVPKDPKEVAWFNLGPRPGEMGSAVIAGHSGYKNNKQAVFDNLYKLVKGDKIYVEDKKGMITNFVVREIRKYNPNTDATEVFSSSDGKIHLNLITCIGIWNDIEKSRSERLVVFTDKEME